MVDAEQKLPLKRKLFLFLASFLLIGSILVFYFGMPFLPLVLGGLLAFILTFGFHFLFQRRK